MNTGLAKRLVACAGLATLFLASATASRAVTTQYYYDSLGRLIGATAPGEQVKAYRYDSVDNRNYFQMTPATPPVNSQEMKPDQFLFRDQSLISADGRFVFSLQTDGNLVLYGPSGALWSSNTYVSNAATLIMQSDGNLVLYDPQWNPLWYTHTDGHPGSIFVIQSDGNLVIYAPDGSSPWNSGTYGH